MLGCSGVRVGNVREFATIISCCDFRLHELGRRKSRNYDYAKKLMDYHGRGEAFIIHLSYLKPLRVRTVYVQLREPTLFTQLAAMREPDNEYLARLGLPHPYLVDRFMLTPGGYVHIWWHLPPGIDGDTIYRWANKLGGRVSEGWRLPVYTCSPQPSIDDAARLGCIVEDLLGVGAVSLKTPALAYVLIAVLDRFRLIPLRDVLHAATLAAARDLEQIYGLEGKIRYKYMVRYYQTLSSSFVVGRYRVVFKDMLEGKPSIIVHGYLERSKLREVYGVLAAVGTSAVMFYSVEDETVMFGGSFSADIINRLQEMLDMRYVNITFKVRIVGFPFPYELYNPLEDRWEDRPVPEFMRILQRMRYLEAKP